MLGALEHVLFGLIELLSASEVVDTGLLTAPCAHEVRIEARPWAIAANYGDLGLIDLGLSPVGQRVLAG